MGLPAIGLALMAGGTAMEMTSTLKEGKAAAQAGKYQQLMYNRQAKGVEVSGLDEIRRLREEGKRIQSAQIVNIAAGGGTLSGTSLKAIVNSAASVEADAAVIGRNAAFEAESLRFQGSVARYEGRMERYGSRIRAAITLGKNVGSYLLTPGIGGKTTATTPQTAPSMGSPSVPWSTISQYRLGGYGGGF